MKDGHFEKHIRKCNHLYKGKHDLLVKTIKDLMGDKVRILGNNAGLHLILEILDGRGQDILIKQAEEVQVLVYPTDLYWYDKALVKRNQVLLGFASLTDDEIICGVKLLNKAWFGIEI